MGSNETIRQAVMAGLGLSLISAHTIASEVADGGVAVLKVEGLPIVRHWFAVRRTDRDLPPASGALWAFIVKKRQRLPAKARVFLDARANILARCGALRETMPSR
jgi:LysR family transcriptional regulator, low CO2-responsive transcriptional regulator